MKTLNEIEENIKQIKDKILCQEIGNDLYYTSPLYHKHLLCLEALEKEEQVLRGKQMPVNITFSEFPCEKKMRLHQIAEQHGYWFADCYRDYSASDLDRLIQKDED